MKKALELLKKMTIYKNNSQRELISFIFDDQTMHTAARGSMDRRIALLDRVRSARIR